MRIVEVRERTVSLAAGMRNADIGFDEMTASAVAIVTDMVRDGRPVVGLAFDSIGRYGHGGLLRERFIPRLLAAAPDDLLTEDRGNFDPVRAFRVLMRNEKLGGHGERPGAVGMLDAALWDAAAKIEGQPLWRLLADRFSEGRAATKIPVYASGGHYQDGDDPGLLVQDVRNAMDRGFTRFKIKFGGLPLEADLKRVESLLSLLGSGDRLAIDLNASLTAETMPAVADALRPYRLAWVEEPVDPLDYDLHRDMAARYDGALATGENIFSAADTRNLLRYGGLRPDRDFLQMDISLSYGITGYLGILGEMERGGWSRTRALPHAGHLLSFHAAAGLGLGGHETAMDPSLVFSGFPGSVSVEDGSLSAPQEPGVGMEAHPRLYEAFQPLLPE